MNSRVRLQLISKRFKTLRLNQQNTWFSWKPVETACPMPVALKQVPLCAEEIISFAEVQQVPLLSQS